MGKIKVVRRKYEQAGGIVEVAIAITVVVVIVLIAINVFMGSMAEIEANVVIELTSCKNVGAVSMMTSEHMPEMLMDAVLSNPNFLVMKDFALIKYIGFGPDKLQIPKDDKWGIVYTTATSTDELVYDVEKKEWKSDPNYHGTKIDGFAISGVSYKPTEASQMGGEKYWLAIEKLRGISETNDPIGIAVENEDYNPAFSPATFDLNLQSKAACWFTVWIGDKPNDIRCSDTGYRPDTNFQMQGISKVEGSGMYVVKACNSGLWIEPITSMQIEDWAGMSADAQLAFRENELFSSLFSKP